MSFFALSVSEKWFPRSLEPEVVIVSACKGGEPLGVVVDDWGWDRVDEADVAVSTGSSGLLSASAAAAVL
jgi:hypothetical protein